MSLPIQLDSYVIVVDNAAGHGFYAIEEERRLSARKEECLQQYLEGLSYDEDETDYDEEEDEEETLGSEESSLASSSSWRWKGNLNTALQRLSLPRCPVRRKSESSELNLGEEQKQTLRKLYQGSLAGSSISSCSSISSASHSTSSSNSSGRRKRVCH